MKEHGMYDKQNMLTLKSKWSTQNVITNDNYNFQSSD